MRLAVCGLAIGALAAGSAFAQYVISAHSGVVQLVEGRAYLNDNPVEAKFGQFPEIKENQEFRTEEGRAEVLLTPGVFLRMGENSSVRMLSRQLTDTRVEVLAGSVMVECDDIPKDNSIKLVYRGNAILLVKHGLYRVDADPARFRVYDGEAIVKGEAGQVTLKGGKETALGDVLMAQSFDRNAGDDELYRWSSRRAGYLAKANISSANSLMTSGTTYGGWQWNPLFGLFTWIPFSGIGYSPFGYGWYTPYSYYYYGPVVGGFAGGRPTSGGSSGFPINSGRSTGSFAPSFSRGGGGGAISSPGVGGGGHMGGGGMSGGGMSGGHAGGMSGGGHGGGHGR